MKLYSRLGLLVVTGCLFSVSPAARAADPLPNAKVAELGLHRIERLVILRKIEAGFESGFYSMSIKAVTPTVPTDPSFMLAATQGPGSDGSQKTVSMALDATGKEISHSVNTAMDPVTTAAWPGADAITISENAFHWIEDQYGSDPKLLPFYQNQTSVALSQGKDTAGNVIAYVDMKVDQTSGTLRVTMKADGTYLSWEIKP